MTATLKELSPALITVNEEYANLIRKLTKVEYDSLKQSIADNGQYIPIVVNQKGIVIDGHHRFKASKELLIEPKIEVREFKDKAAERKFIHECNVKRRHLNLFENILTELQDKPKLEEIAKQNMSLGGKGVQINTPLGRINNEIGKRTGVGETTVRKVETIIDQARPEILEKTKQGKLSIDKAYRTVQKEQLLIEREKKVASCSAVFTCSTERLQPTILWTGNGYHIYIVINTKTLNLNARLVKFCPHNTEVNKEFLRFAEWYLTSEKCDPEHAATLSFKSCLLRVPGSFNSKCIEASAFHDKEQDPQVKIVQESIGIGELNDQLIRTYRHRLIDMKLALNDKELAMRRYASNSSVLKEKWDVQKYAWIEKLVAAPIANNRYFAIFRLVAPYYRRILKLPYEESEGKIREWLLECNKQSHVTDLNNKIDKALKNAHNFRPMNIETLKEESAKKNNMYKNILDAVS